MSFTKRIYLPALIASLFAVVSFCAAQEVDPSSLKPQLSDLDYIFKAGLAAASAEAVGPQPAWVASDPNQVKALKMTMKIQSLPNMLEYDTSKPPMSHHWWNYPIYGLLGFPRDLIDGFFGVVGEAPFELNIPTTGAIYEFVPTQILMRDPRDWHRWPGRMNANGHGFYDGTWGWFSNYHYTTFSHVDTEELARWEAHNRQVEMDLAKANQKIDASNEEVKARREAYLKETRALFAADKHRDVIRRMIAYREADPLNSPARALLVASLIDDMNEIPEHQWVNQTLANLIWGSSRAVLLPARDELKNLATKRPSENALRFLVAINLRLENYALAMEAAKDLIAMNPSDIANHRLKFEAALAGRDEETIESTAKDLEQVAGVNSATALHARGRQALVTGHPENAVTIYLRATALEPLNARFHYLEAMSLIEEARVVGKYNKAPALKELKKAIQYALSSQEETFYRQTLAAAGEFRIRHGKPLEPQKKKGGSKAKKSTLFGTL